MMTEDELELARAWAETAEPYPVKAGFLTLLGEIRELQKRDDIQRTRIRELEHAERVVADLMALLAARGTVISHDDAARILAQALKKPAR